MSPTTSPAITTGTSVFESGKYKTLLVNVETTASSSLSVPPPKPLLIATPSEAGEFPVLLLLHGYLLSNSFYSQLIQHIASHGFIVVAPQLYNLYSLARPDTTDQIKSTAATTNWFSEGLKEVLPTNVHPNLSKIALSGHSRGGKAAFALALGKTITPKSLKFSALIGIDPVDGMFAGKQTRPPVLTYVPNSFDLEMAVLVIGAGLGEVRNFLLPPLSPKGVNHDDFFKECKKPACHFVAKDYGHADMLDDDTKGIIGKITYCLCKSGKSRKPMRSFVGGLVVAFLRAYLEGNSSDLVGIRYGHERVPLELQKVEFLDETRIQERTEELIA